MRQRYLVAAALAIALAGAPAVFAADAWGAKAALAAKDMSLEQIITWAAQDEYLVRAEYAAIIGRFGSARPFTNIIRAEETHATWLADLAAAHGITLPKDSAASLVAAPKDFAAALEVGRQVEIDNIAMYDRFLARELPADARQLFERLKAASQNHLRAFTTNLARP